MIMAKGYLVARIQVHDTEMFEKFKKMSEPIIAKYGGKIIVRNPNPDIREGSDSSLVIILEFKSLENARKFYESDSYKQARAVRKLSASTDLILVEGM